MNEYFFFYNSRNNAQRHIALCEYDLTRFNKIAIQGTPQILSSLVSILQTAHDRLPFTPCKRQVTHLPPVWDLLLPLA